MSVQLADELQQVLKRTESIFDLIQPEAYYEKPIPLRHPIVFYEGHLPGFTWNTLFRKVLGEPSFNPELDILFARGIDPADTNTANALNQKLWPDRAIVLEYKNKIYERLFNYLETEENVHPILYLLLEHDLMHQETLLYIIHQLPHHLKIKPTNLQRITTGKTPTPVMKEIDAGMALLGARPDEFRYVWDNEEPAQEVFVPGFSMDAYNITNGEFLAFIEAEGCKPPEFWYQQDNVWFLKDFFEDIPLPLDWPVYVTQAEAMAYAHYVKKDLPTEAQWHRAAYGDQETLPPNYTGNFDFKSYSPVPVGSFESLNGVYDLVGNGWEWTATPFMPFPGFKASEGYPQYSADFFDGEHYVIKGGSNFTDARLLRRSFRNWFYSHYPYMYATFRCVSNINPKY